MNLIPSLWKNLNVSNCFTPNNVPKAVQKTFLKPENRKCIFYINTTSLVSKWSLEKLHWMFSIISVTCIKTLAFFESSEYGCCAYLVINAKLWHDYILIFHAYKSCTISFFIWHHLLALMHVFSHMLSESYSSFMNVAYDVHFRVFTFIITFLFQSLCLFCLVRVNS